MKVCTVSEMRRLDKTAVTQFGIREELLMENAGLAVCGVIEKKMGIKKKNFLVFCGLGNNGGDGFVVARKLHSNGANVKIFILGNPKKFKGVAAMNLDIVRKLPIEITPLTTSRSIKKHMDQSDAIIDAIFGTGITRDVGGLFGKIIDAMNSSGKTVFSVDIPSGIHGNDGSIMGKAVKASYTITFGLPKVGNLLYPGSDYCGTLFVTHISFPQSMITDDALKTEINSPPKIPARVTDGHKGSFGQVLFIAGASHYFGAPYFSAYSFLKAGGGYSRLAAPTSIIASIAANGSEIVFLPQSETETGSISLNNKTALLTISKKMDMIVIGPGLSLNTDTQQLVRELAMDLNKPLLIDGDGITAVSDFPAVLKNRKAPTILTPHLGEMSGLTKRSVSEIQKNKLNLVRTTAKELNATIVLKGAHSLVGYPDGRIFINMTGNSGMASSGSGDVLTGTIAAMFGLGLSLTDAVRKGVFIHGLSGDLAATANGEDGVTAKDIMDFLPLAVKKDREDMDGQRWERIRGLRII